MVWGGGGGGGGCFGIGIKYSIWRYMQFIIFVGNVEDVGK